VRCDYATARDALGEAIVPAEGISSGSTSAMEYMTTDQRLEAVEIAALLSIAQELSLIHHQGVNPDFSA
jgi:hypothetical protein